MTREIHLKRPSDAHAASHGSPAPDVFRGTVFRVPGGEIVKLRSRDLTVLQVKGRFSPELAHEVDRVVTACPTDLGLDLSELAGIGPPIVPFLDRLRRRAHGKRRAFRLSNMPSRLVDVLKLGGAYERFCGEEDEGAEGEEKEEELAPDDALAGEEEDIVRGKISTITHSLHRTAQLERSLETAGERLSRLFPQAMPKLEGLDFAAFYQPCEKVGGDFFDFIELRDGCLAIVVGDVSGHGLEAAIVMGMVKKLIQVRAREASEPSPAAILSQVNRDIFDDLDRKTFATAFFGILEPRSRTIRFVRAGHEPTLVVRGARASGVERLRPAGLGLAMAPGPTFDRLLEQTEATLEPGESLIAYSDGIVEARDPHGRPFGRDRLAEAAALGYGMESAGAVLTAVRSRIRAFVQDGPQEDDMMALVIHARRA